MSYNIIEKHCAHCEEKLLLSLKNNESIEGEVFCSPNCLELEGKVTDLKRANKIMLGALKKLEKKDEWGNWEDYDTVDIVLDVLEKLKTEKLIKT